MSKLIENDSVKIGKTGSTADKELGLGDGGFKRDEITGKLKLSHDGAISNQIATIDAVETLENKTIIAADNSVSGLLHGTHVDDPAIAHGTTSAIVGVSDTQTLSNKTISDSLLVGVDLTVEGNLTVVGNYYGGDVIEVTDPAITVNKDGAQSSANNVAGIEVDMSDADNAKITYDSSLTSKWKVGDITSQDEILTSTSQQIASNKSIQDPQRLDLKKDTEANLITYASGAIDGQMVFASDTLKTYVVYNGSLNEVGGGGSGQGGINYITNYNAEDGLDDWSVVGTIPFTQETTSPLFGTASFKISSAGADYSGNSIKVATQTIDPAMATNVLSGSVWVRNEDLNSEEMGMKVYDVTNAAYVSMLQGSTIGASSAGAFSHPFKFQATDSLNYEIHFEVLDAATKVDPFAFLWDEIQIGPEAPAVYGLAGWKQYDMTVTGTDGWVTNRAVGIPYKTLDGSWHLKFNMKGTVTSATGFQCSIDGIQFYTTGTNYHQAVSVSTSVSSTGPLRAIALDGVVVTGNTFSIAVDTASTIFYISGDVELASQPTWAADYSNMILSETTLNTAIVTNVYLTADQAISTTSITKVLFDTVAIDKTASFNLANNRIDILEDGDYDLTAQLVLTGSSIGNRFYGRITINGSATIFVPIGIANISNTSMSYPAITRSLVKGDYVEMTIQSLDDASYSLVGTDGATFLNVKKINTGAQTIASEAGTVENIGAPVTDWEEYTPVTSGFGTLVSSDLFWKRVGDSLEVRGYIQSGAPASSEAQIGLPSGLTIDSTKIPFIDTIGYGSASIATASQYVMLGTGGDTYLNIGFQAAGSAGLTVQNGNAIVSANEYISFFAKVPISTWSSGMILSESTLNQPIIVRGANNDGRALTASVTNINWTETEDTAGAWDGDIFTAPEDGSYSYTGMIDFVAGTSVNIQLYVDNVFTRYAAVSYSTSSVINFNGSISLKKDEQMSFRIDGTETLQQVDASHYISIEKLDVGGQTVAYPITVGAVGAPVTNWEDKTAYANANLLPTGGGTLNGTYTHYYSRRVGDMQEVYFYYYSATAGSGTSAVLFPTENGISTSLLGNGRTYNVTHTNPATTGYTSTSLSLNSGAIAISISGGGGAVNGALCAAGTQIYMNYTYKVSGWQSNVVMSDTTMNMEISANLTLSGGSHTNADNWQDVPFNQSDIDTVNSRSGATYVIPESGTYKMVGNVRFTANATYIGLRFDINGAPLQRSQKADSIYFESSTMTLLKDLNKGDVVKLQALQGSAGSITYDVTNTYMTIQKTNTGSQTIAASEKVVVIATDNTAVSLTSGTYITYPTVSKDTHSAWNTSTGVFTVPRDGYYTYSASIWTNLAATATNQYTLLKAVVNGSTTKYNISYLANGVNSNTIENNDTIYLNQGDELKFQGTSTTGAGTLVTGGPYNRLSIISQ